MRLLAASVAFSTWLNVAGADTPADRFVASLDAQQLSLDGDTKIPAEALDLIRSTWAKCDGCDGEEFMTQGLAVLSPVFREGLDAYDADDYERCAMTMRKLQSVSNPFISTNAAAYEIKALVAMERLVQAGQRIEALRGNGGVDGRESARAPDKSGPHSAHGSLGRLATYSYFAPEIDFLHGFCLLSDLQYDAAAEALTRFLETHGEVSQRLTIAATQMLAELANREDGRIGEVVDLMHYSRRRLHDGDTGDTLRERQDRIVGILDSLIDEAEQSEQSGEGSCKGGGSDGGSLNRPMQESRLPQGQGREESVLRARRANPGEAWGSMPPAQREQVLQALRDSFPSRYRRLVEQYYEELAKKP